MTRLEAIRLVRNGIPLIKEFPHELYGIENKGGVQVYIQYEKQCRGFQDRRKYEHEVFGPIHVRLWALGLGDWVHIGPKQLLTWIRRNYPRK